jgi:3'-phosphoadenosine 5'-phosphosulfate sulfotransferase (PAPS reductase)/FAD synthetase
MIDRYQTGKRTPSTMQFILGTKNGGHTMFRLNKKAKELLLSNKLHKVSAKCCDMLKKKPAKEYQKKTKTKAILGVRGGERT